MHDTTHLVIAECSDHCGHKTKGDRLQHQAFCCMASLDIDVTRPRFPYLTVVRSKAAAMQITADALVIHSCPNAASASFSG